MQQTVQPNRRHTPSKRRRHAAQLAAASAQRSYASENDAADIARDATFQPIQPRSLAVDGPRTPRKANSPAPASGKPSQPKHRSANKARPQPVSTSPGPMKPGRRTPPPTAVHAGVAYAGATFHGLSPAPSSLPIPKFLAAKTMPESPGAQSSSAPAVSQEPSPPPTDSERPTPVNKSGLFKQPSREESPLDIFFLADRAEKERVRRASSANAVGLMSGPFSPPPEQPSPPQYGQTIARMNESPLQKGRRMEGFGKPTTLGISRADLDGPKTTPSHGLGPAFSTPYQDRIKAAARTNDRPSRSGTVQDHSPLQPLFVDRSEALKNNHLHGAQMKWPHAATEPPNPACCGDMAFPPLYSLSPPATLFAQQSLQQQQQQHRPAPPASNTSGGTAQLDLRAMEARLRAALKLDPCMADANPS